MRLAEFIRKNQDSILKEWEDLAHSLSPNPKQEKLALRDYASSILLAIADEIDSRKSTDCEPCTDSKNDKAKKNSEPKASGDLECEDDLVDLAAEEDPLTKFDSGFDVVELVSEYRALRSTVLKLWDLQDPKRCTHVHEDLRLFNEAIDESLVSAVCQFVELVERSRQIFLAILGHDLRNPLAAISMGAQVMSLYGQLDPKSAETVSDIRSSAKAMDLIITDLLEFSAGNLGAAIPIRNAQVDLRNLCEEVAKETRSAYPSCSLEFETNGDDFFGLWDAGRLRQLISNLLGNAAQHGDGLIKMVLVGERNEVILAVSNGGFCIPEHMLEHLFDPMRRTTGDTSGQKRIGSMGLGLYIARQIAEGHGGTIEVEANAKGVCMFTVELPRESPKEIQIRFEKDSAHRESSHTQRHANR